MPLQKLQFKPGINKESTSYSNEGGWFDCDKVRFRAGYAEKIGGWSRYSDTAFLGTCRSLFPWSTLDGTDYIGLGTEQKYYLVSGGSYYDITPLRLTTSAGDATFAATNGSTVITVTENDHGARVNDYVTFSGAASLGGTITAAVLNIEYQITSIVNANQFTITSAVAANSSDTGNGGSSTVAAYQINVGLDTQAYGNGWGAGAWNGVSTNPLTTTLAAALNDSATSVDVADATGIATNDFIQIDDEFIKVTGVSSNTLSLTRGIGGTTAAAHLNGETVRLAHGNALASDDYATLINGSDLASNTAATSVTVDTSAGFASSGYIKIDDEIMGYSSKADATHINGLQRAQFGTTAATHADDRLVLEASFGWGMPVDSSVAGEQLRVWSVDNFGEDLLINTRDGDVFYWDATNGPSSRAVKLSSLASSNKAPTVSRFIVTSDIDRHLLFFGCDPEAGTGTQDPLLIRFGDQESLTEFQTLATNTAGELRIGTGSEIVAVKQTKQQILVWTDISLHTVQYVGPPYTFSLSEISRSLNIIGPNSAVAVNDIVLWMGNNDFYVYAGNVQKIFCSVKEHVFSDFNFDQSEKVIAGHNSAYGEVWWFYCSKDSSTNDKYVIYNYEQKIWYIGNLNRTAWIDRAGTSQYPIAASTDNRLYYHEFGHDDGSTNPASGISAHIESSQIDVGDGEQFMFARRLIPDVTFRDSTHPTPAATFTIKAREYPGADYNNSSSGATERSASSPIELFTNVIDTRIRGRSFAIRLESTNEGTAWRLGTPRVDLRTDGRR
jgi:hypothetical protein